MPLNLTRLVGAAFAATGKIGATGTITYRRVQHGAYDPIADTAGDPVETDYPDVPAAVSTPVYKGSGETTEGSAQATANRLLSIPANALPFMPSPFDRVYFEGAWWALGPITTTFAGTTPVLYGITATK